MRLLYQTTIILLFLFAVGHVAYTPVEFTELNEPALWFLSGAVGVLFGGFLNYLNYRIASPLIHRVTLIANGILLLFCTLLAIIVPEPQTIGIAAICVLTTITGFLHRVRTAVPG